MKTKVEKPVSEALDALFEAAKEFAKLCELNKITSHFTIADEKSEGPVTSPIKIQLYQPSDDRVYNLETAYTHVSVDGIVLGKRNTVEYKRSLSYADVMLIKKETERVLVEFKKFNFGSLIERSLLSADNEIKYAAIALKKAKAKKVTLQTEMLKSKA